jgi:hypothetical protein
MRLKIMPALSLAVALWEAPMVAYAQAGPPFQTNDPGTPGNANWEINLGTMPAISRGVSSNQIPQIDLNYGLGDRIQLTYEVPYVFQHSDGQSNQSGWGNGYPGVKWRFVDGGDDGWQISAFPQIETGISAVSQKEGLGVAGPRYLLPIEVAKKLGPLDFDIEAGHYLPVHGPRERILGFVMGRSITDRFELDAEVYDDRARGVPPNNLTLDIGGRYKLSRGIIALFMLGRSLDGFSDGQPEFLGYLGIQILLSDYGRTLTTEP